jgi:hypothetical protein
MYRQSETKLIEAGEPHGIPGQLNVLVPDVESYRTSYGAHNRIVVGLAGRSVYMREDRRGLPDSTEAQRLAVLREDWPGMRVVLRSRTESEDGRTIEYEYDHVPRAGIRRC